MNGRTQRRLTIKHASTIALTLVAVATIAQAHGLRHSVSNQGAVVVTITHDDGTPFSDQLYQVYHGNDTVVFQTGKTDALGRVVFLPDRSGPWRVRAFSEDGHGIDVRIASAEPGDESVRTPANSLPPGRGSRLVVGVAILFGIFGVLALLYRRKP